MLKADSKRVMAIHDREDVFLVVPENIIVPAIRNPIIRIKIN
jgi:hypothetical protein